MLSRNALVALIAAAVSVVVGAAGAAMTDDPGLTIALALALAAAHAIELPTAAGRGLPLTAAVAVAGLLVSSASLYTLLAAGAVGLPIGYLVVVIQRGGRALAEQVPGEPVAFAMFVIAGTAMRILLDHSRSDEAAGWIHLGVVVAAAIVWFGVEIGVRSLTAGTRRRVGQRLLLRRGVAEWQAFAALCGVGATFGLTVPAMGWWAVPLAAVPYLVAHLALVRARHTRRTYRQTIGALGRIPEAGGFSAPGHSERTAELAVAIGSQGGLSSDELDRVEQAALLHDIGRLVLNDPAVASGPYSTRDLAQWSAAIVAEVRHLQPVADVVAEHYRPYRRPGEERDETVATPAQVVKVASAYSVALSGGMSPADSLELLHQGSAYDYDPEIVTTLRHILKRRGVEGV